MIAWKMWPLVITRSYADLARWPSFWPRCSSFELDLEIIKTKILSKIHDDCFKNVTARVLTRFSTDLAQWPSFWPHVTQFQTYPRNQDKHFEQDSWWLLQKCDCKSINKVFYWFGLVFDPKWPSFKRPRNHQDKHFEQDSWWLLEKCNC